MAGSGESEASSLDLQRWQWTVQWHCDLCAPSEDGGESDPGPDLGAKEIEEEPLFSSLPRALRGPEAMKPSSGSGFLLISSYGV